MLPIIAMMIGGGAIAFGIIIAKRHNALRQSCTQSTSGVVARVDEQVRVETYDNAETHPEEYEEGEPIDENERYRTREVTTYYPVFEYTAGERTITATGSYGTGSPKFRPGEQVTVFYNPNNPDEFYVAGDVSGGKLGLILVAVGVGIIAAGIVLLFI